MLLELYIILQILTVALFFGAFFTKNEIIWAVSAVFSGVLMFSSWNVEYYVYQYNMTISAYQPFIVTHSYGYMMALNMLFFVLGLILGIFDLFDKYGSSFTDSEEQRKI